MRRGMLFVMEGCDGSGKTTISTAVIEKLKKDGIEVVYTREPGGIDIAEQIRNVILDPKNTAMDVRTEALLYAASRRQHLMEKILPNLEAGKLIVCDRFVYSSLAYQGYARGIGMEEVWKINQFAIEGHMPDHTIFLDIPAEVGLSRIQSRTFLDRLDQEGLSFHEKVFEGYQQILHTFGNDMEVVNANRPVEEIVEEVYDFIKKEWEKC